MNFLFHYPCFLDFWHSKGFQATAGTARSLADDDMFTLRTDTSEKDFFFF